LDVCPRGESHLTYMIPVTITGDFTLVSGEGRGKGGQPRQPSVGDGFPDQLGDIEDQVGLGLAWGAACANFPDADADCVVQSAVGVAVGHVKHRPDDLAAAGRVGTAIPVPLQHDHSPVVGLDDSAEVGPEGAVRAVLEGEVRAAEPPVYPPLAASLSYENIWLQPPARPTAQLSG